MTHRLWKQGILGQEDDPYVALSKHLLHAFGPVDALILQVIHGWCRYNSIQPEKANTHLHDDMWWMYMKQKEWAALLKVDPKTVGSYMNRLSGQNVVLVGNFNKRKGDRTKWYTLNYGAVQVELSKHSLPENARSTKGVERPEVVDFGPFGLKQRKGK